LVRVESVYQPSAGNVRHKSQRIQRRREMRRSVCVLCLLFAPALMFLAVAQDALNNEAVVKMVKSGLGENLIISMVQGQPGKYSLNPDELVKLKEAGVSEKILAAMAAKGAGGGAPSAPAPASATATGDPDIPRDTDVGVYFKKGTNWESMLPEVVNWKTGGVLKHIASAGVVKGDVNGNIQNPHSRNSVKSPIEVLIHAPEGVEYTEYQLIHLHENPDNREFRTVTGGVMHTSSGATRDVVPFEGKAVGKRLWKVLLPNLGAGGYGFLPPGAFGSANSASIGKMYTFRLIE
jgi:competence protein ComGC